MIQETKQIYRFNPPFDKIHHFYAAYDQSLVVICQNEQHDTLYHFDKQEKLVLKYQFKDFVDTLCMPDPFTAIVLDHICGCLRIFDLKNSQLITYPFKFKVQTSCQCYLDYFLDSRMLLIRQNGDYQDSHMKLSYLQLPLDLSLPQNNIKVDYVTPSRLWEPTCNTRKIGTHSQVVWYPSRFKDLIEIKSFKIVQNKGVFQIFSVKLDYLSNPYKLYSMELSIVEILQFQPNVLCLICSTNKEPFAINQYNIVNNNFIWDLSKNVIRQSQFHFGPKYQDLQIDIIGCPLMSMFRTFYFEDGEVKSSPAFFIHNANQTIFHTQSWKCSHLQKYYTPSYCDNQIHEGVFENSDVDCLILRRIIYVRLKEMSIYMLINAEKENAEDWDDDLLADIFDILDYPESLQL